jgi:hypothetical protein
LATVYSGFFGFLEGENNKKHHSLRISGVLGCSKSMSEQISEKPPKKVKIHSSSSFWWHVIKKSFKEAWEPFETVGTLCAIFAGMVATAYLTHQVTQEWGDYMIYWSIAVPVGVWWVLFLWNLIKIPHKIYKEDLTAAISGATPVFAKEITSRNFGRVFIIIIVVSAFVALLSVRNLQIAQLKSQLNSPKQVALKKPLPIKIIPRPEPPPAPPPPVPIQQAAIVESQKFENFNGTPNGAEDVDAQFAKLKAETTAKAEAEHRQKNLNAQGQWDIYLPYYQHSLVVLHDVLTDRAANVRDGIVQSVGYFQCLPSAIDYTNGSIKVANIGFQNNTNM